MTRLLCVYTILSAHIINNFSQTKHTNFLLTALLLVQHRLMAVLIQSLGHFSLSVDHHFPYSIALVLTMWQIFRLQRFHKMCKWMIIFAFNGTLRVIIVRVLITYHRTNRRNHHYFEFLYGWPLGHAVLITWMHRDLTMIIALKMNHQNRVPAIMSQHPHHL